MKDSDHSMDGAAPTDREIQAFQRAARDLIGVALHSVQAAGEGVSLAQMRVLVALRDLGRCPSSKVAAALGLGPSSITRLADRLASSGLVERGAAANHRGVVTLELTAAGRELVEGVLEWRRQELDRILSRIDPAQRALTAQGLERFHEVVGTAYAADPPGPVPL